MIYIIQDFLQRINTRLSSLIMASIIGSILILLSFLIGRQSVLIDRESILNNTSTDNNKEDFALTSSGTESVTSSNTNSFDLGRVYGSSKGKKYYIEGLCDGNISNKNKVFYKSEDDAKSKGKSRASSCK